VTSRWRFLIIIPLFSEEVGKRRKRGGGGGEIGSRGGHEGGWGGGRGEAGWRIRIYPYYCIIFFVLVIMVF